MKILKNKFETRNPKFETICNDQNLNVSNRLVLNLAISDLAFAFVSNFELRISDLSS